MAILNDRKLWEKVISLKGYESITVDHPIIDSFKLFMINSSELFEGKSITVKTRMLHTDNELNKKDINPDKHILYTVEKQKFVFEKSSDVRDGYKIRYAEI